MVGSAHHRSLPGSLCRPCLPADSFRHCSFEEGLCSWEVEVAQPMWERNTSLNLGTSYGIPTRDHSSNSRAGTLPSTSQGAPELVPGHHGVLAGCTLQPLGQHSPGLGLSLC